MTPEFFLQILTIAGPVVVATLTGGGIVAYFQYRSSRPESAAKAKQINATAEISVAEAWQRYAEAVEKRFNDLETKYDKAMKQKDGEIARLNDHVGQLEKELKKYRGQPN